MAAADRVTLWPVLMSTRLSRSGPRLCCRSSALNSAARASNQLVFIDFTGYTCTNCRWMEANMFSRPEVRNALSGFVLSRLFTDGEGSVHERQQQYQEEKFGTIALPLYAIVDSNGATVATFSGLTRNSRQFISFLRKASDHRRLALVSE